MFAVISVQKTYSPGYKLTHLFTQNNPLGKEIFGPLILFKNRTLCFNNRPLTHKKNLSKFGFIFLKRLWSLPSSAPVVLRWYFKTRKTKGEQTHNKWLTLLLDDNKAVRDEGLWNSFPRFLVDCWLGWLGGTFSSSPVTKKSSYQYYNLGKKTAETNYNKTLFFALVLTNMLTVANWIGTLSKSGSENFTQKQDSRCLKFHRSYFNSSSLS